MSWAACNEKKKAETAALNPLPASLLAYNQMKHDEEAKHRESVCEKVIPVIDSLTESSPCPACGESIEIKWDTSVTPCNKIGLKCPGCCYSVLFTRSGRKLSLPDFVF